MGLWDYVTSIGKKIDSADFQGIGQKLLHGANVIGSKVSSVGHSILDSDLGKAGIMAINPELLPVAEGALTALDTGLGATQKAEQWLKPQPKEEKKKPMKTSTAGLGIAETPPPSLLSRGRPAVSVRLPPRTGANAALIDFPAGNPNVIRAQRMKPVRQVAPEPVPMTPMARKAYRNYGRK